MGLTDQDILDILNKINLKEKVSSYYLKELIKVCLNQAKWMGKVFLNIKMEISMMVSFFKIKSMVLEDIQRMKKFFKENGKMELDKEKVI